MMNGRHVFFSALICLLACSSNAPQNGEHFIGESDTYVPVSVFFDDFILGLAQGPTKAIYAIGTFSLYDVGSPAGGIMKLRSNGVPDTSFDSKAGFGANSSLSAMVIDSHENIYVSGFFTSYNAIPAKDIVRIKKNGKLDQSFSTGDGVVNGVLAMAPDTSGKLYMGGSVIEYDGNPVPFIARLNADGSFDPSFLSGGSGFNSVVRTIKVHNGKIYVGGAFSQFSGQSARGIAILTDKGLLDSSFNAGNGCNGTVLDIEFTSDEKIIVAGEFAQCGSGTSRARIARYLPNGTLDTSFNVGSGFNGFRVENIEIDDQNRIYAIGDFQSYNGEPVGKIARLNPDGRLDKTFNTGGSGYDNPPRTIVLAHDQLIYLGGSFKKYNDVDANYIIRLKEDGSVDDLFTSK